VLAVGDAEVVVGVIVLGNARRRVRRADAEHGGRPPSARCARLISWTVAGALPMDVDDDT
jgi:hypothetical protein